MPSRIGIGGRILRNNVKALREARGWTQEILGDKIGSTATSVSRIERQKQGITLEVERLLLDIFGVAEDELYAEPTEIIDSGEVLELWKSATPDQRPIILRTLKAFLKKD